MTKSKRVNSKSDEGEGSGLKQPLGLERPPLTPEQADEVEEEEVTLSFEQWLVALQRMVDKPLRVELLISPNRIEFIRATNEQYAPLPKQERGSPINIINSFLKQQAGKYRPNYFG